MHMTCHHSYPNGRPNVCNELVNACEVDLVVVDKHYTVFAYVLNKHAAWGRRHTDMQCPILKKLTNYCLGHAVICASAHHKDTLNSPVFHFNSISILHHMLRCTEPSIKGL